MSKKIVSITLALLLAAGGLIFPAQQALWADELAPAAEAPAAVELVGEPAQPPSLLPNLPPSPNPNPTQRLWPKKLSSPCPKPRLPRASLRQ